MDELCHRRVEAKLRRAARDYRCELLQRLEVEFASRETSQVTFLDLTKRGLDLTCFVSHEDEMLFAAVRGTDLSLNTTGTAPRRAPSVYVRVCEDMRSNVHVMLGYGRWSTASVERFFLGLRSSESSDGTERVPGGAPAVPRIRAPGG